MKTKVFLLFLLMMTLAAYGAAQMNFDIDSPYLTYTKLDSEDAPPVLIDVLGGEELPEGVEIIGGADGSTSIIVAEEDGPTSILLTDDYAGAEEEASWPRTFTITLAGYTMNARMIFFNSIACCKKVL